MEAQPEPQKAGSVSPPRSKAATTKDRKERRLLRRHMSQLLEMEGTKRNLFCKMRGLDIAVMKQIMSKTPHPKEACCTS